MADRNLTLAMRVTADPREMIGAFTKLKKGAQESQKAFDDATEKVAALARQIKAAGEPSAQLVREFEAAKRSAATLKDRFIENRQALELQRRSLTGAGVDVKNLAAEYRRLATESKAAAAAQKNQSAAAAAAASLAAAGAASRGQTKQDRLSGVGSAVAGSTSGAMGLLGVRSEKDIQREILGVQQALQKLGADAKVTGAEFDRAFAAGQKRVAALKAEMSGGVDPFTASVARATGGVNDLRTQLGPLAAAFTALAAARSVGWLINLADTYGQMTARVRLATQYTGDFDEVMAGLEKSARDTYAPLAETAELYGRMAPSLTAIGRTGDAAVGVITTVSQAVALSGGTAQGAAAALQQFGQMVGGAAVQAEEWNSVADQTPALAAAIAEGFGVSITGMKALIATGDVTGEQIIKALEKVRDRVQADFDRLPKTIGQAMTVLQNQLLKIVGSADQGAGALSALARAIVFVSDGLGAFAEAGETIAPVIDFIANGADGIARIFRILGTELAGFSLAVQQALSGDLDGALATYEAIREQVRGILDEPLAEQKRSEGQAKTSANARLKVEQDLAKEIQKLEKLRTVAAGEANADILLDDQQLQKKRIEEAKKATEEELKGVESLRGALQSAWQTAIDGARQARAEAAALLQQAADARLSGTDKANARRNKGLSDEERAAIAERDAATARDAAASAAARAVIKGYEGDLAGAEKLAAEAAKQAERAEQFANAITDDNTAADLLEELGKIRAQALEAQARIKQQEAKNNEDTARAMQDQILAAETRIKALKVELAKPLTIQLDITAAEAQIKRLQEQLAKLDGKTIVAGQPTQSDVRRVDNATAGELDKTVTVTADTAKADAPLAEVKTAVDAIPDEKTVVIKAVNATDGSLSASDAASAWNASQPGFAGGGHIRGPGTATSDSIIARLSDGEYVVRAAAVRRYGLNFLHALNGMSLPKFATGGLVSSALQPALADSAGREPLVGSPLVMPDGTRFPVMTTQDVHAEINRYLRGAVLARGSRRS